MRDRLLFQVLQLLRKICTCHPDILTDSKWEDDMETVTGMLSVLFDPLQKSKHEIIFVTYQIIVRYSTSEARPG
jgi:hypothetical protein